MSVDSSTSAAARADTLSKIYGEGEAEVRALDGVSVTFADRPLHRHHGPERVRQVDLDAHLCRARLRHVGHRLAR